MLPLRVNLGHTLKPAIHTDKKHVKLFLADLIASF